MRTCISRLCLIVISMMSAMSPAAVEEKRAWTVATFECLGLYYPSATEQGACNVQHRQADENSWREALPLVYDSRERQYRGSLVGLKPDTAYLIRLTCGEQPVDLSSRRLKSAKVYYPLHRQ